MKTEACGRSGLIYEPIAGKLLTNQPFWKFEQLQFDGNRSPIRMNELQIGLAKTK